MGPQSDVRSLFCAGRSRSIHHRIAAHASAAWAIVAGRSAGGCSALRPAITPSPLLAADHGHTLNFDQQAGPREAADGDERTRRKAFFEYFLADVGEAVAV